MQKYICLGIDIESARFSLREHQIHFHVNIFLSVCWCFYHLCIYFFVVPFTSCSADKSCLKRKLDLEFQAPEEKWCMFTHAYASIWPSAWRMHDFLYSGMRWSLLNIIYYSLVLLSLANSIYIFSTFACSLLKG